MKLKLVYPVLVAASVLMCMDASAQSSRSRKQGEIYITNQWYENWSVGASGGFQSVISGTKPMNKGMDFSTAVFRPSGEFYSAKWFTPLFGVRMGFQGGLLDENRVPEVLHNHAPLAEEWKTSYAYASVMWNLVTAFAGYKEKRFFSGLSPYIHGGYYRLMGTDVNYITGRKDHQLYRDREMAVGVGLFATFRITSRIDLTADFRDSFYSGRFHSDNGGIVMNPSLQVGLQYTIRKGFWRDATNIVNERDEALASAAKAAADAEFAMDELRKARNRIVDLEADIAATEVGTDTILYNNLVARSQAADLVIKYYINSAEINFSEEHHLGTMVQEKLKLNPETKFVLTATYDSFAQDVQADTKISFVRAYALRNLLVSKYGVKEENIKVNPSLAAEKHIDNALDRCVLVETE